MTKKTVIRLLIILSIYSVSATADGSEPGSNVRPITFGKDQTIVDLRKIVWKPLVVEGLASGAEIAVLRGNLGTGNSESVLKLPPGYAVPRHNHTSDELYVWIEGTFSLIGHDDSQIEFDGPAYINFPGNAPPHGLKCSSKKACLLYIRLSRPFDIKYFPKTTSVK